MSSSFQTLKDIMPSAKPMRSRLSLQPFPLREGYEEVPHRSISRMDKKTRTLFICFSLLMVIQAIVVLTLEGYVFGLYTHDVKPVLDDAASKATESASKHSMAIPTFLTLYIFGFVYELFIGADALRLRNSIQLIGLCICNLGLLIYGAVQIQQIQGAVVSMLGEDNATRNAVWPEIHHFLIAIPCVIAFFTLIQIYLTWLLYQEFGMSTLKISGGSLEMRRIYLTYQMYMALLKFDFFFFLGFTVQFVVIVQEDHNAEFDVTVAAMPVTILILLSAVYATRKENKLVMLGTIILYLGGLAYFIFKLVRMYYGPKKHDYDAARRSLSFFAVITIILILLTIINACMCLANFGKGLLPHLGFHPPLWLTKIFPCIKSSVNADTEMEAANTSQKITIE